MGIRIKNLGEFGRVLREYREVSSRKDPKVILDTKAFYIARGACRLTPKADALAIGKSLSALIYEFRDTKKGASRNLRTVTRYDFMGRTVEAPLAALIVNARRARQGKGGLYGKDMEIAIRRILSNRVRTIAFLKSGWLPAIRELEQYAENKSKAPPRDPTAQQYGHDKGGAAPAARQHGDLKARTIIRNAVTALSSSPEAAERYARPAFEQAWNNEIASMKEYIADKMRERAREHGFKVK